MKELTTKNIKLGIFVSVASICLILGLYFIGSKRNIFDSKIKVSAVFNNINGLMPGNNVQFNGINVGTVSKVYAISDTAIKIEFTIDKVTTEFITTNAIVSIGTDGLLGNKLVNIAPDKKGGNKLKEGDMMNSINAIQYDKAIRTLLLTNENLKTISDNLTGVSDKFNQSNSLWKLLGDSVAVENVKSAIVQFKLTGTNTAIISGDLSTIISDIKHGKGTLGTLLMDTILTSHLNQTMVNIKIISDTLAIVSGNFLNASKHLTHGYNTMALLLTDTTTANNLKYSILNAKQGTEKFNENMKAVQVSWPFKKYFKNKLDK